MKRIFLLTLCCVVAVFAVGCASMGSQSLKNETTSSVSGKLEEGKTTKHEVQALFGAPSSTTLTSEGLEIWKYKHTKAEADAFSYIPYLNMFKAGTDETKKELTILFDNNGVVKRFVMNEAQERTETGLVR